MNKNSSVIIVTRKLDTFRKTEDSMAGRSTQKTPKSGSQFKEYGKEYCRGENTGDTNRCDTA
jgi:hypothetical protein